MTNGKARLIGLAAFKPKQKKYQDGRIFLSVLIEDDTVLALDVRFFLEDGKELTPTRNGFRVPTQSLDLAEKVFRKEPRQIDDVINSMKKRELHARFVDDNYGQAVDIRYYKKTEEYTGWEKRGLRLRNGDFKELVRLLGEIELATGRLQRRNDLFEGKSIVEPKRAWGERKAGKAGSKEKRVSARSDGGSGYINEALMDLLN